MPTAINLRRRGVTRNNLVVFHQIQTKTGTTNGTTTVVLPGNPTVGNLLILAFGNFDNGGISATVTPSGGGVTTWHQATGQVVSTADAEIWYGLVTSAVATTTLTVTATPSGGTYYTMQEWSGAAASPLDQINTGTAAGTSTAPTPAVTPGANGELVVAVASVSAANTTMTGPTGSWSAFGVGPWATSAIAGYINPVSGSGSPQSTGFTSASPGSWSVVIASFKHA